MKDKLFKLDGQDRLNLIRMMSMDERDEVCESINDCKLCPLAVIYKSHPYCADVSPLFRIRRLLSLGASFVSLEVSDDV